jgi:phosphatidylserine/phosphatidylglycerophosphate/cardiolipin synthase-like enzyme
MTTAPDVTFLRDTQHGGAADQAGTTAAKLAAFAAAATKSLDIAIYDFRLSDPGLAGTVVDAFTDAAARGVTVRIAYDAGKPDTADAKTFAALQADPAPPGTAEWVTDHFADTAVATEAITAGRQLMHSKYIVRDAGGSGSPAVWTGSTNFTDDAWNRQENNIIILPGAAIAADYRKDFDQMWTAGAITGSGAHDAGTAPFGAGTVGWDFSPADGSAIDHALTERITKANRRILLAAMVLTSHRVLAALADAITRGVAVSGIYDGGQMDPIVKDVWEPEPHDAAVLADWRTVAAHLARKNSTPYTPTSVHDFMHLKVLITDDELTTGSYNFSANAERNAENQIHLDDPGTVSAYADYITAVAAAYATA